MEILAIIKHLKESRIILEKLSDARAELAISKVKIE